MVNLNDPAYTDNSDSAWDFINSVGGRKSITFAKRDAYEQVIHDPIGTSYTGIVTEPPVLRQVNDYKDGMPLFWKDGNPQMQIAIITQTEYRDPDNADDDGIRAFFLRNQALRALQDEMKRLGIKKFGVGTRLTQTLVGLKPPTQAGWNPQKIYQIDLVPATSDPAVDAFLAAGAVEVTPQQQNLEAVQQPPAQQYQSPAPAISQPPAATPPIDPVAALLAQAQQAQPNVPVILEEHVNAVKQLAAANIDRETAITAVTAKYANGDAAFRTQLDNAVAF